MSTKVVYVRFSGPDSDQTKTYSDDIILDTTPPDITSASAATAKGEPNASAWAAVASKSKWTDYVVRVNARDRLTGVKKLQVNTRKTTAQSKALTYRAKPRVTLPPTKKLFLRARDGAGNWTAWRWVKVG